MNMYIGIIKFILQKGIAWFIFRLTDEMKKKLGYFHIIDRVISIKAKKFNNNKLHDLNLNFELQMVSNEELFIKNADEALNGNIFSFSNTYLNYWDDGAINWTRNPVNKIKVDEI